MANDIRAFFERIMLQPAIVSGHVVSVAVDPATGQQQYATVSVGGSTVRVRLDPGSSLLANGDQVRLEEIGFAASADYRLAGIEAGARPGAGLFQVLSDGTTLAGATYMGGDLIFGKLDQGNLYVEHGSGRLYHRVEGEVYGIEYPDGSQLFGHAVLDGGDFVPDGPNVWVEATGIRLRHGAETRVLVEPQIGVQFSAVGGARRGAIGFLTGVYDYVEAVNPWYRAGNAPAPLAAYQAVGAVSQASSYVNLANPGTYDLTLGTAPTWSATTGWTFNGTTQYLKTGLTPGNSRAWTVLIRYANAPAALKYIFGGMDISTAAALMLCPNSDISKVRYFHGGNLDKSPGLASGVLGIAGTLGYRNGVAETGTMGAVSGSIPQLAIGAFWRSDNSPAAHCAGNVLAFAAWDSILTPEQIAAVTAEMNALTQFTPPWDGVETATIGVAFGNETGSWFSVDEDNGYRQFVGGTQRSHIRADGSGWFVGTDKLSWDTAGNLALAGDIQAQRLHIGQTAGPSIRGGMVVDVDAAGEPVVDQPEKYGLRLYDRTGLPRIALLTGTTEHPELAAALFGLEDDPNYLWYKNGLLRLKGEAVIDGGQLGGWMVEQDYIESLNHKVRLVNNAAEWFHEGLLLTSGAPSDVGVVAWRRLGADGQPETYTDALLSTARSSSPDGELLELRVTASDTDGAHPARDVAIHLEALTVAGEMPSVLRLQANDATGGYLMTNVPLWVDRLQALTGEGLQLVGTRMQSWIGPAQHMASTQAGTAGRLASGGTGIQSAASNLVLPFQLDVPAQALGRAVRLTRLTVYYNTTLSGAYITSIQLVRQNLSGGTTTLLDYTTDLGNGSTGAANAQLLSTSLDLSAGGPHVLLVTPAGVTDYGQVVIYGFLAEWETI